MKKQLYTPLVVLFGAGLAVVAIISCLQSQTIRQQAERIKNNQRSQIQAPNAEVAWFEKAFASPRMIAPLSFIYPKGWSVETYEDEFTSGQKNVRVVSSKEPQAPGKNVAEKGLRIEMGKLAAGQKIPSPIPGSRHLNITKGEVCKDNGCPQEEYFYDGDSDYRISVYYSEPAYANYIDLILMTLQEK